MTTSDLPSVPSSDTPLLEVLASRQFTAWLADYLEFYRRYGVVIRIWAEKADRLSTGKKN